MIFNKGKKKCKVCNKYFKLDASKKYIVSCSKGLADIMTPEKRLEAIDCPTCGCQNILNIREGNYESNGKNTRN